MVATPFANFALVPPMIRATSAYVFATSLGTLPKDGVDVGAKMETVPPMLGMRTRAGHHLKTDSALSNPFVPKPMQCNQIPAHLRDDPLQ